MSVEPAFGILKPDLSSACADVMLNSLSKMCVMSTLSIAVVQIQKKKIWEELQPSLKTDQDGVAEFDGLHMLTSAGAVRAATLTGASIS